MVTYITRSTSERYDCVLSMLIPNGGIRINGAMLGTTQLQTYLEKPFQEDLREQKLFAHFL